MPEGLIDIGGGVKMVNPSAVIPPVENPIAEATQTLGLIDLIGKVKDIPVESAKKIADLKLSENDVFNIDVQNQKLRIDLQNSIAAERRDQIKFFGETIDQGIKLFQVDPVLGASMIQKAIPNIGFAKTKEGAYQGIVQGADGKVQTFLIDPDKIADPKERQASESQLRNQFNSLPEVTDFKKMSQFYNNIKALKKSDLNSGASDVALVYAFAKMNDPGGRVTSSDQDLASDTPGLSQQIINRFNKARSSKGPIFDEKSRAEFLKAADAMYYSTTQNIITQGQTYWNIAKTNRYNPETVATPVGNLKQEDFRPISELTPQQLLESGIRQGLYPEGTTLKAAGQ